MIVIGYPCDSCIHENDELKDGWIVTCKAFPEGIDAYFFRDGHPEYYKECNNGIGFEPKENPLVEAKSISVAYQEYKESKYQTVDVWGNLHYRAMLVCFNPKGTIHPLVLPEKMFEGHSNVHLLVDEKDNIIKVTGPAMINFSGEIPDWYKEFREYIILNYDEIHNIGKYFRVLEEDAEG